MENLLLLAESGMGKTMLLQKFRRDRATSLDRASGVLPKPVVLALMPDEPSEEAFFVQVLKAVDAPLHLPARRNRLSLRETTFRILRELQTRMLMIDEINSILVGSARQQRYFLQLLRFLSKMCIRDSWTPLADSAPRRVLPLCCRVLLVVRRTFRRGCRPCHHAKRSPKNYLA